MAFVQLVGNLSGLAWTWGLVGGGVSLLAARLLSLPLPWLIFAGVLAFGIVIVLILTLAPSLDSALWKDRIRPGVSGAFTVRVVAKNLPEYLGLDDETHAHILRVRDCVFTNISKKRRSSIQLHLAVQRSSQSGWFYFDDPALPRPQGYLPNPIDLPPRESARGHFLLLLNPMVVPFASQPNFPNSFARSMETGKVALVLTDLLTGKVTAVPIPTNA